MELGGGGHRIRHVHRRRGLPRRHDWRKGSRQYIKVAARHGNHIRVELGVDEAQPLVHVLPHFPVSVLQKAGDLRGRLCCNLGGLRVVFVYVYLCAG